MDSPAKVALTGGGPGHEYIIWINGKWCEFRKATNPQNNDNEQFDSWLRDECRKFAGYTA